MKDNEWKHPFQDEISWCCIMILRNMTHGITADFVEYCNDYYIPLISDSLKEEIILTFDKGVGGAYNTMMKYYEQKLDRLFGFI